jgi:hypothetical protein
MRVADFLTCSGLNVHERLRLSAYDVKLHWIFSNFVVASNCEIRENELLFSAHYMKFNLIYLEIKDNWQVWAVC